MNMRLINILPALMLALPAFAVRIEQSLIEINANGYNAPVRITPTNSAYAPADLSAPIVTGPTRIYTPVAGVLTISNLVQGAYTFEQAGKRLTFTVTNSLPTITNSIRELVSAGLVYGVNGPGFPGVVKATPTDTTPAVLGAKLVAGSNITITTNDASGNATLTITGAAAGGSDAITNNDTRAVSFAGGSIALSGGDGANQWSITNVSAVEDEGLNFIGEGGKSVTRFIWNDNFPGIWAHNFYGLNSGLTNASGQTISQEIAAAGGSGDATLAGDNTWTGTNTFNNGLRIGGEEAYITDDGSYYAAGLIEVAGSIRTSTGFYGPLVTNDAGALLVNGVPFVNGGMDASNILTGTIDAARLPTTNSSWKFEAGSANTLVVTNGRVGIGLIEPTSPLTVNGHTKISGNLSAYGLYAGAGDEIAHNARNRWTSPANGTMAWANAAGTILMANTNGSLYVPTNLTVGGLFTGSGAGLTNLPYDALSDAAKASITNAAAGGSVPAGIVTNNHAAAVTFSNDVTVASNLVVQGSSTFEALNVGELNVTNLAASIIDSTNIINGTISSNDIAAGTIGTNLLSQAAYDALSDTAEYWSTNVSAVTSNGLYATVPKLATANAFANSNYFGSNVVISGGSTTGELATIVAKFTGNGAGLSNVYGAFIKSSPMPTAAQIGTNGIALWNSNLVLYAVHVNGDGQYSLTNQISPAP